MNIGYACVNTSLPERTDKTFRLASYSPTTFREVVGANLTGLQRALEYNAQNQLLAFRISSNTIPFASHSVQTVPWQKEYAGQLRDIGRYIQEHDMRVSMHPGQFVVLNSTNPKTVEHSIKELEWHSEFLDLLGLDASAKIQIHVGGAFGDKSAAKQRWVDQFTRLPDAVKARLAIEHDERLFSVNDCLDIHAKTNIPVIFDSLHFAIFSDGLEIQQALQLTKQTWQSRDGDPLLDYSDQAMDAKIGKHAEHLDTSAFSMFIQQLQQTHGTAADIILEIKDKQASALVAEPIIRQKHVL